MPTPPPPPSISLPAHLKQGDILRSKSGHVILLPIQYLWMCVLRPTHSNASVPYLQGPPFSSPRAKGAGACCILCLQALSAHLNSQVLLFLQSSTQLLPPQRTMILRLDHILLLHASMIFHDIYHNHHFICVINIHLT